ncbi:MAG: excinuclease ABC subunit UvrC [Candidatus Arsenophonus melophagi]|nr:excinuclease ABC subunit UvrC [Candidatus Arsenophonus melophagi]
MSELFDPKVFLETVTNQPGVYRMYDTSGVVIYVGKAKDLKKRLVSYFRKKVNNPKIEQMVKNIGLIDITVTHTETEALLLEHNYIKLYQPRYNVLLRDDKSYPYIFLSADKHPRLNMHRGAIKVKGEYFGPFPSVSSVKETLTLLQKLFSIRQCKDSIYLNRSKPCLQYQINRCLGPCIRGLITDKEYHQQVEYVRLFLSGKDHQVLKQLTQNMEQASQALKFEMAAHYRDQIKAIQVVTEQQFVSGKMKDLDVISVAYNLGISCVHVLFVRQGKILGSRNYYPKIPDSTQLHEVVQTFLGQFYLQGSKIFSLPEEILLDFLLPEKALFVHSLSKLIGRKLNIQIKPRGIKAKYLQLARTNAVTALETKIAQQSTVHKRMQALADLLGLEKIYRIECFDISHTSGQHTVASCVVFNKNGPLRSEYRHYNIINITPGDDYAAMKQALMKRYSKPLDKNKVPNVIFIDGGKGQLAIAISVFQELTANFSIIKPKLIAVAKGRDRKVGLEKLFLIPNGQGLSVLPNSPALHLIQNIRDESHNHAITRHRMRRAKMSNTSTLESIEGVGPKRRQLLLKHMGSLEAMYNASIDDLAKVPMISSALAEKIHNTLKH